VRAFCGARRGAPKGSFSRPAFFFRARGGRGGANINVEDTSAFPSLA